MAIAPETTSTEWAGESGSTGDLLFFLGEAVPPSTPEEIALVERLIARSVEAAGLDREALRRLDDAWGSSED